jgi:hypothetical protein
MLTRNNVIFSPIHHLVELFRQELRSAKRVKSDGLASTEILGYTIYDFSRGKALLMCPDHQSEVPIEKQRF